MLTEASFDRVRALVRARAGLDLGPEKRYLAEARLGPIARDGAHDSLDALVAAADLAPHGPLARRVVEAMLTCETSFFRDPAAFEQLAATILPELARARATTRQLTLWSAACASGQEPYSVAMLLSDRCERLVAAGWSLRVVASDVSQEMLARTRAATYSQFEVNRGLPARHLVRFLERDGSAWRVRDEARRLVEVRQVNLVSDPLPAPVDVVLLRNVLIYFDAELRRAVLDRVLAALRPDGALLLGAAETTLGVHDGFEPVGPALPGWYRPRAVEVGRAAPLA